ncbi:MAG: 2-nitropropane dioxygenase [Micrococcales bacterium]|nr:MAG: 2-nitropropane dioxygenase [Micrococcales bacterium]PIE26126.1 MAG: 2-nitropropane dioxygenase [Micrococcales bacterium]
MFDLRDLTRPVIAAPMAGGISTPKLVRAVESTGGLGFLAAGYKTVDALMSDIDQVHHMGAGLFGVNLFVPDPGPVDLDAARAYRDRLAPLAAGLGVSLPEPDEDDDGFAAKVDALLDAPVPVVSFTFSCPTADVVRRFRQVGTATMATVTSAREAQQAAAAGVDALVAQGPYAGGHRATFDPQTEPPSQPLPELLDAVRAHSGLPLIASGGMGTADDIRRTLRSADAVQLGTAFLDADEAGTSQPYRQALHDPRFGETIVTRAFSGRYARGLRNAFIDRFHAHAPAAYPAVNQLTAPIRAASAAAGDADLLSLWAGTGWSSIRTGPAAGIVEALLG